MTIKIGSAPKTSAVVFPPRSHSVLEMPRIQDERFEFLMETIPEEEGPTEDLCQGADTSAGEEALQRRY